MCGVCVCVVRNCCVCVVCVCVLYIHNCCVCVLYVTVVCVCCIYITVVCVWCVCVLYITVVCVCVVCVWCRCWEDSGGSYSCLYYQKEMSSSLHISCRSGTVEITGILYTAAVHRQSGSFVMYTCVLELPKFSASYV